ncbi:amino acid adenylation domain-containing protein [Streptomyces omiyaensis]|uniref:Amino acid adenylation domain-containing protein n=1 Tax=Streptomyces omiyaensis TaxID=68247 RepID=A0ABW7BVQ1_9ACTN
MRDELLRQLVEDEGYRIVALEGDCAAGSPVDDYVTPGTGDPDDVMARGFSHGFGGSDAPREPVRRTCAHDEGRPAAERVRFAGVDGPLEMPGAASPRQALTALHAHLAARCGAAALPCTAEVLDGLLGEDGRWTEPAAMRDPSRSVGRSPGADRLRPIADAPAALLDARAPDLADEAERDAWHRARLCARTAAGLLRHRSGTADASPARLGEEDAFVPTALRHRGVQDPPPDTVEGLLPALPEGRYAVDVRPPAAAPGDAPPAPRESPRYGDAPPAPSRRADKNALVSVGDAPEGPARWPAGRPAPGPPRRTAPPLPEGRGAVFSGVPGAAPSGLAEIFQAPGWGADPFLGWGPCERGRPAPAGTPEPRTARPGGAPPRAGHDRALLLRGVCMGASGGVSSAQEAMWLEQNLAPEVPNSTTTIWDVRGDLDLADLDRALRTALGEAGALLVNFRRDETGTGGLRLVGRAPDSFEPFHADVAAAAEPALAAREFLTEEIRRPFDLATDALFRVGTVRLGDRHHLVCLVFHHILTDAFGVFAVLSQRFAEVYRALRAGEPVPGRRDTPAGIAGEKETAYRSSARFAAAEEFWKAYVTADATAARLPAGLRPRAAEPGDDAGFWDGLTAPLGVSSRTARVPAAETDDWRRAAEAAGTSVPDLLTAAATAFLRRLCDTPRPLLSFTVNYRRGELRNALGLYSNALPLAVDVPPAASVAALAEAVRLERLRVLRHAEYNVALIKRSAGHAGDARSPFGPVVNVIPFLREIDLGGAVGRFAGGTFGLPDEVRISTYGDGGPDSDLYVRFDAPGTLYGPEDVAGLVERFVAFVRAALADPHARVQDLGAVDAAERAALLALGTGPVAAPGGETVTALIDRRAAAAPDAVAVVHDTTTLGYGRLAARADRLARRLAGLGAGPERVVAVAVPRSAELAVAVCAVLKAGAVCLPVDPGAPSDAMRAVLDDARPVLLLTAVGADGIAVTPLDAGEPRWEASAVERADGAADPDAPPLPAPDPAAAAWLRYEAAESGTPTGLVLTHAALADGLLGMQQRYRLDPDDRVLHKTPAALGAPALWELLWPLTAGAAVTTTAQDVQRDAAALAEAVRRTGATTLHLTPSVLAALVRDEAAATACKALRRVLCGGEALPAALAARFRALYDVPLHHVYGPAGTALDATAWEHRTGSAGAPLGRPVRNTGIHLLDGGLHPVPAGVVGEVYVSGTGLARGLAHRPGATAERFVPCPFGPPGGLMHRTGDLARWNADGELEHAGRADRRVRIRGLWAEPATTEAVLAAHPGVARAAVVPHSGGDGGPDGSDGSVRFVAHVVPGTPGRLGAAGLDVDFGAGLDVAELRRFAADRLPDHLVPAVFLVHDSLPLTAHGTLDRAALPAPQAVRRPHRVARTAGERLLAEAFAEVLGTARVGLDDDFFTLGGDSISAMRVVTLARAGGLGLTARTVFECRTVAALAAAAGPVAAPAAAPEAPAPAGPVPLPPMARLFAENGPGLDRLAQWLVLTLPAGLTAGVLTAALGAVLDRHDVLRSRLSGTELHVGPPGSVAADRLLRRVPRPDDLTGPAWQALLADEAARAVAEIDATAGEMLRLVWFEPSPGLPGRLLVAAHHLVVDGMSWRVIVPDLAEAADALRAGRTPAPAPVGTSPRQWADALAEEAARPARTAELDLWRGILAPAGKPLGARRLDPATDLAATARTHRVEVPADLGAAVLTSVPAAFRCGVDDVLLTALVLALADHRGPDAGPGPVVRLEGHGRQEELVPGADLTRTVGWFTTVHPVRFDLTGLDVADALAGGPAAAEALRRVKESRRALPDQGIGYTLLRYLNETTAAVLRELPADEVGFNHLGRFAFDGSRADGETPWTPAPETAGLVAAPAPGTPMISALSLDSLVARTGDGDRLRAFFGFAPGVLSEDEVRRLADTWQLALRGLRAQAAAGAGGLTPSDVPLVTATQRDLDGWKGRYGRIGDVWPLTPLQQGLLFHSMLGDAAAASYQTQFVFRIDGAVDPGRLRTAAQHLLDRHPNLRVAFASTAAGDPVQVVVDGVTVPFRHLDLTGAREGEQEETLARILAEEREERFPQDTAPLLRFHLVTLAPDRSELALTAHHVLFDGWSLPIVEQELMRLYADGPGALEPAGHGYREFLRRQARRGAAESDAALAAWADELSGVDQPTLLAAALAPAGERAPDAAGTAPGRDVGQVDVPLTPQEAALVVRRAAESGITPNVLVQGAWAVVLAGLTGSTDVVLGSSVTVRPPDLPGAHTAVGMFTNTVPVRVRCAPGESLAGLLRSVQDAQARTLDHHHVGLGDIHRATGLPALFDTIVIFESFPVDRAALSRAGASAELTVTGIRPFAPTHYPLTVLAAADPMLAVTLQHHPDVLDTDTVEAVAERLARVLRQFAAAPETRTAAVDLLSGTERSLVLRDWNATALAVPAGTTPERFAEQAGTTPYAVALEADGERITYAALDARANRMAHWLVSRGVGPESRVVVLLPRSADLVVALLAVWKAGGCYVPVDPDHPAARIRSVIEDSEAALVLDRDLLDRTDLTAHPAHDPGLATPPGRAAYTIYTSGSTGTPKGVVVPHGALANFLAGVQRTLRLTPADALTAVTTVAFDIAALELFLPLTTGARVVLAGRDHVAAPQALLDLVEETGTTVMQATPALWQMLALHDAGRLAGLRVLTGGEALPAPLAGLLTAHAAQVVNLYGPTETTIWSTLADVADAPPPSIGTPLANQRVRVLDPALRPVPPGVAGDLWIAGDGLARGYHRRPGMTAGRFTADPYGPPGSRMYRTGDLARWSPTGEIEYLGRADFQIKLRGFRIEPGDVEHALTRHPAVREAVVVVREDQPGDRRLVGYVVAEDGAGAPPARELQSSVRAWLPDYMVPSAVVLLPAVPRTANGKLDRARLPRPEAADAPYRAPGTPRETALCALFAELLGVARVGLDDDFFALGGHSLLATRLAARVRSDLGVELPLRTLFAAPTVAELGRHWDGLSTSVRKPLRRMTER